MKDARLIPIKYDVDFETLCCDIAKEKYGDYEAQKYGRRGQKQWGVDIVASDRKNKNEKVVIQCKYKSTPLNFSGSQANKERKEVQKDNVMSFIVPQNVGGRFSVLSPVGLISAAFTGIDIEKLLLGAEMMDKKCDTDDLFSNPAALFAAIQYLFYWQKRPISVMMPYSNALYAVADWYRQLWAESLGKKTDRKGNTVDVGPTPVKALGATDQHSQVQLYIEGPHDKIITFLSVESFAKTVKIPSFDNHYLGKHTLNGLLKAEEEATRLALTKEGRPNLTISIPKITPETIGQLLYMLELATAYAGELFDIEAFDQPGVELGKQLTYALMGREGFEDTKKEIEAERANASKREIV